MEEKFEALYESYINGNRSYVRKEYERLSGNEMHNMKGWIWEQYNNSSDKTAWFEFVVFLAF